MVWTYGDNLDFAALRPDFKRLIPNTVETSFENQNTFSTKQQVTNQIKQTMIDILTVYFLSLN